MKKLICVLVLLAMLVPVVAMAEIPLANVAEIPTDRQPGLSIRGYKVRYVYNCMSEDGTEQYVAQYYLTGALDMVTVNYDQGPGKSGGYMAEFGASGVLKEFMPEESCTVEHDIKSPVQVKLVTGENANKPAEDVRDVAETYGWDSDENGDFLSALKAYNMTEPVSGTKNTCYDRQC